MAKSKKNIVTEGFTGEGLIPPQSRQTEGYLIGAIMLERDAFDKVSFLPYEAFYVPANQIMFRAFINLRKRMQPIDLTTVCEELISTNDIESVGGIHSVTKFQKGVVSTANIEDWAMIILKKYQARELIRVCRQHMHDLYMNGNPVELGETLSVASAQLSSLHSIDNLTALDDCAFTLLNELDARALREEDLNGVPSGFYELDKCTNGWQPSDLIILGARPSVGKSALSINLAINAAFSSFKIPVYFASLEMSKSQITERIFAERLRIALADIRRKPTPEQMAYIHDNINKIEGAPIYLDDTASLNWMQLKSGVKKWISKITKEIKGYHTRPEGQRGLIIVDYLQLMSDVNDGMPKQREQQISTISRQLKILAKETKMPIIALSQLGRDAEKTKREPVLSDLRESGAIEQDADVVLFIYRPDSNFDTGETIIKIAKHRNGALERIKLIAKLHIQKFFSPSDSTINDCQPINNKQANNFTSGVPPMTNGEFDEGRDISEEFKF